MDDTPKTSNDISPRQEALPLRPTHLQINLDNIAHNLTRIHQLSPDSKIMGIVKANAYGHGLTKIGQFLEKQNIDYLGVALVEEGIELRNSGVRCPILVMGALSQNQIPFMIQHGLTFTIPSVEKLKWVDRCAAEMKSKARVHLKIDTGMERIGTHWYSSNKLLEDSLECQNIEVEGIYSHFANADQPDSPLTKEQLERFMEVLEFYPKHSLEYPLRHIANSAGILNQPSSHLDMVRSGLILYGYYPNKNFAHITDLRPAMRWVTEVSYFKVVEPGMPVSYGSTWKPDKQVRMVTLPVGYGDGYSLSMSNVSSVLIRGKKYPVAGKVCMDQTMININDGTAYNGDEVVLLGTQEGQEISIDDLACWGQSSPYEILTNMNARLPRVYSQLTVN